MTLQAVVFDIDGTLLGYEPSVVIARISKALSGQLSSPRRAVMQFAASWSGEWPDSPDAAPRFWQQFAEQFAEEANLSPDVLPELTRAVSSFSDGYFAFPDAAPAIGQVRARGLKTAILTNHRTADMPTTLNRCGLDAASFDAFVSCYRPGFAKPDPRAYSRVADLLEVDVCACAFVDDTPGHVQAASELGMQAWLIDRDGVHSDFAGTAVSSLRHLADDIDNILGFGGKDRDPVRQSGVLPAVR